MAIDTITQTIDPTPPEREILVGSKNLPENIQWFASANGMPLRSTQINIIISQMNTTTSQVNTAVQEVNSTKVAISSLKAATETAADEAKSAQSGAEAAYQNTATILEEVDITGTGGYTVEAVDDLISRQRNLQLIGLNLI